MPCFEDTLVQQTTAEYLETQVGWDSVFRHVYRAYPELPSPFYSSTVT